jgi:hypothetical protein
MRTIILTRDKKAKIKNRVNVKKSTLDWRNSLYILEPKRVQNYSDNKGKVKGTELVFFEENPNPLTHAEKPEDLSLTYLDDIVIVNLIQQTTGTFGKWDYNLGFLGWFTASPIRIPALLMLIAVGYIVISNFLSSGAFL